MAYANLLVTTEEGVAEVLINRDDVRNALAPEVRRDLLACFADLASKEAVRAIVLSGQGRSFSAGGSIRHFAEQTKQTPQQVREELDEIVQLFQVIPRLTKPVVAAVNGHAFGGGCGLALCCDITLASDKASFGFPEITRGFVPALVAVPCLQRLPLKKAVELLLSGESLSGSEAVAAGLASRCVPHEELLPVAHRLARRLAGFSPGAVQSLKQLLFTLASSQYESALYTAREVSALMRFSKDFEAGVADFLGREPR